MKNSALKHATAPARCQPTAGSLIDRVMGYLFPSHCVACQSETASHKPLCQTCWQKLPWQTMQCQRCALPIHSCGICGQCLRQPPPQSFAWACFRYTEPVSGLLQSLKFHNNLLAARSLGQLLLANSPPEILPHVDYLVPAPLHLQRLRQRGYNQALELCRPLARAQGLEIRQDLLHRTRETSEQSRLNAAQRQRNVEHAFACRQDLDGEHILLFDDVMTTGATMRAMAQCLLKAGAGQISCLAVARTPCPSS